MVIVAAAIAAFAIKGTWCLAVGGDIMLNGIAVASDPLKEVAEVFSQADLAYANVEVPFTEATKPASRKSPEELRRRSQFVLKVDPAHIDNLMALNLDIVSLGNNHAMDYGDQGLYDMTSLLFDAGIMYAGAGGNRSAAEGVAVASSKPEGLSVGLLSFLAFIGPGAIATCSPAGRTTPGVAALQFGGVISEDQKAELERLVSQAKEDSEFVIVALHWGLEKHTRPTPYQVALGRALIDAGADVVLGSHPHVLQGAEIYKGKPIFYSLGNLISAMPAQSGAFRLWFEGDRFTGADGVGISIFGGRARIAPNHSWRGMNALSEQIAVTHRSKHAAPLLIQPFAGPRATRNP